MTITVMLLAVALAQAVPQPFPRPGGTQSSQPQQPTQPAPQPSQPQAPAPSANPATPVETPAEPVPTEATLGVPLYPSAQFIASYDAGRGQRFYLFGTSASFVTIVQYYRNVLKNRGDLVFEAPATHQFDIGRFREETMAFPPSVTIKDYESAVSKGYPNPKLGAEPERFPTVIQIVPAVPERR